MIDSISVTQKTAKKISVGIDLGTTYSTITYIDESGKPVSIENASGQILTPSAVCVEKHGIVVGADAVKSSVFAPESYFECFKREMGEAKKFSCKGVEIPPEVLSALVLEKLKTDAEQRIGPFQNAVVTVPAYFDENRRQATVVAAELAGINVLEIINYLHLSLPCTPCRLCCRFAFQILAHLLTNDSCFLVCIRRYRNLPVQSSCRLDYPCAPAAL